MSDIVSELKDRKRKIADLQQTKARQEGQESQLLKNLKEKFNIGSIGESEKMLEVLGEELIQNEKSLEKNRDEMDGIIARARQRQAESEEG